MAEPKQKAVKSAGLVRRGAKKLSPPFLVLCSECKSPVLPHHICQVCGTYKGKQILEVKTKVKTKIKDKRKK